MNWPLILTTGLFTLAVVIFFSLVLWVNWDELTGKNKRTKSDFK